MSEIGRDTLVERFGQGARERLIRLHDLARFDIDDLQVRSDTRRTFAANRLVRAWLPAESARRDLVEIRESVAHVLRETPWKFSLWHAVVRTAARRPNASSSEDDRLAKDWLATQLGLVASVANDGLDSWLETWPEDTDTSEHHRDPALRELYLSFHRGAFWHALAMALRSLWWHVDEASHPVAGYAGHSPNRWTVRAVQEGSHAHVRSWLGALDQWADVLYPADRTPDLTMWRWELDQLTAAALASVSRYDVAVAWRHADPPGSDVMVPAGPLWDGVPHIARVLERNGRVSRIRRNTILRWPLWLRCGSRARITDSAGFSFRGVDHRAFQTLRTTLEAPLRPGFHLVAQRISVQAWRPHSCTNLSMPFKHSARMALPCGSTNAHAVSFSGSRAAYDERDLATPAVVGGSCGVGFASRVARSTLGNPGGWTPGACGRVSVRRCAGCPYASRLGHDTRPIYLGPGRAGAPSEGKAPSAWSCGRRIRNRRLPPTGCTCT